MKVYRSYHIPPLYDLDVEIDAELKPTFAGYTFVVTGITMDGFDLYDHPDTEQSMMFLLLAHEIQDRAEADNTILDALIEDEQQEAA